MKKKLINNQIKELILQKIKIEEQILFLQNQLKGSTFSKVEKIELFNSLFICREDIIAKKHINKTTKKENFFALTQTFGLKDYLPISNELIEQHLRGQIHLGSYVINKNNECKFLVIQIPDEHKYKIDACFKKYNIEASYEISSKNDLFVWVFFETYVSSKKVNALGIKILKESYLTGKLYPSQTFVNESSLGNIIELPLELNNRNENRALFVDINKNEIIINQWFYLSNIKKVSKNTLDNLTKEVYKNDRFEELEIPTFALEVILYDFIYFETKNLKASFLNRLKSFATFENPQIKTLLALRKPLYNTPKFIKSYEEDEVYLKLPRGLIKKVEAFLKENSIIFTIKDKRFYKKETFLSLKYELRAEQNDAISSIIKDDYSICVAPPGFGKTLIGACMIEKREASTLVIVNKNMLLDQWIDRFIDYFGYTKNDIGFLGKSKNTLNKKLDIATMQSLKNDPSIIKDYAFVIVDECHHIPAITFEQIIKEFHGKYILGLSATPNRKDNLQPILFEQLGPISYSYKKKRTITHTLKIVKSSFVSDSSVYATLLNELCLDENRNKLIIEEIKKNINRKILLLSDRIEHLNILQKYLDVNGLDYVLIHGSLTKKEQQKNIELVKSKNLVLATTSYFGEGIDFPHLNTIIFVTPISYYGRLVQYLGRVGRDGQECLSIDFVDSKNAMLNSTFKKRKDGYKQMHYKIK